MQEQFRLFHAGVPDGMDAEVEERIGQKTSRGSHDGDELSGSTIAHQFRQGIVQHGRPRDEYRNVCMCGYFN